MTVRLSDLSPSARAQLAPRFRKRKALPCAVVTQEQAEAFLAIRRRVSMIAGQMRYTPESIQRAGEGLRREVERLEGIEKELDSKLDP